MNDLNKIVAIESLISCLSMYTELNDESKEKIIININEVMQYYINDYGSYQFQIIKLMLEEIAMNPSRTQNMRLYSIAKTFWNVFLFEIRIIL